MEMNWSDAIKKVLEESKTDMHYTEISEEIAKKKYRTKLGATPQQTVNVVLNNEINQNGDNSLFITDKRGYYRLKSTQNIPNIENNNNNENSIDENISNIQLNSKFINAYGIYWKRNYVYWKSAKPDLLGIQQTGANPVNFQEQKGIYLLHDARETIYVGQALENSISTRLKNHTTDRLNGRWDRFSWFGIYPVKEDGQIDTTFNFQNTDNRTMINFLEAILIETIEPRQNRKSGNFFGGLEYIQEESKERQNKLMKEQIEKLFASNKL